MNTLDIEEIKRKVEKKELTKTGKIKSTTLRAINILKILERDNFKCVECSSEDELTIEHPEGRDFAKRNDFNKYKYDKCVTMCRKCHLKKNKELREKGGRGVLRKEKEIVELAEEILKIVSLDVEFKYKEILVDKLIGDWKKDG